MPNFLNNQTGRDYDTSSNMAGMPWNALNQMRVQAGGDPQAQAAISPFEHRAYARDEVQGNPLNALLYGAGLIPGYQAAKMVGLIPTDSQSTGPSWDQFIQGQKGVGEGLSNWWQGRS